MRTPALGTLRVFETAQALAEGAAEFVCERAEASHGRFVVSLSGGSTPKPLYQALASDTLVKRFPWDRAVFLFGDERFVPPDDPASNYRMVREAMFSRAPVPQHNIHPVPTVGVTAEECAEQYERTLVTLYGGHTLAKGRPLHDVMLLGLGDDGHTASLIPGEPVLHERDRWVAVVGHGRPEVRITLTYPPLESSAATIFLVAGEGKREILDRVLSGQADVPAAKLRPEGELYWFVDRAAAGGWAA
jgi:6-phosphogluconolactonase